MYLGTWYKIKDADLESMTVKLMSNACFVLMNAPTHISLILLMLASLQREVIPSSSPVLENFRYKEQ